MRPHVKFLECAEYPTDGKFPRTERLTELPTWLQVEAAIRELNKHSRPHVVLTRSANTEERTLRESDVFEVAGGNGDYWVAGTMHGYWRRRAVNPTGSRAEIDRLVVQTSGHEFSSPTRYVLHDLEEVLRAARYYYDRHDFDPALEWEKQDEPFIDAYQCPLYEVLVDVGQRPGMYDVSTMGELKCFVEGYRLAASLLDTPPSEIPPMRQFTEWLVRQLGRGNKSFGWWQIIQWDDTGDETAIADFARLINLFARRVPRLIAHVEPDSRTHCPTGEFSVNYRGEGNTERVDLSDRLPSHLHLLHYDTDPGYYLEYHFNVDGPYFHEQYFDCIDLAYNEALRDFRVVADDWKIEGGAT